MFPLSVIFKPLNLRESHANTGMTEATSLLVKEVIFPSYEEKPIIEFIERVVSDVSEGGFQEEMLENLFERLIFVNMAY